MIYFIFLLVCEQTRRPQYEHRHCRTKVDKNR